MRKLTIPDQSWSVDDVDEVDELVSEKAERLESEDPVEAASVSYSYARL
jgi:hypothetical protein